MANLKITQLPSASIATGSNVLPIVQGGDTDQITVTNLGQGILNLGLDATFGTVSANNNGNGTNFKVGDDVWIGDVNISNTMQIRGQQDATKGFIKFSSGSSSPIIGSAGNNIFQITGSTYITGSGFINNNSILTSADTGSFLTNDSSGSNVDTLGGGAVRTLYSRNSDVTYTSGSGINVDFFSGSVSWGSRNLPQSFFDESLNFTAKILHFRTVGKFASGGTSDTNAAVRLQIGNQIISGSDLGTQSLVFTSNKPFEILGELIITAGSASACYSIGWCDQTGDMKRTPLSNTLVSSSFANLTPGNFEIVISGSTNRTMTTYYSYFQVYN